MTAQILSEQQRRLHNIATIGTVFDVNPDDQTMRLDVGDNQTDWLPIPPWRLDKYVYGVVHPSVNNFC